MPYSVPARRLDHPAEPSSAPAPIGGRTALVAVQMMRWGMPGSTGPSASSSNSPHLHSRHRHTSPLPVTGSSYRFDTPRPWTEAHQTLLTK